MPKNPFKGSVPFTKISRGIDDQNSERDGVDFSQNRDSRTDYAKNFGENLANYTNMALTINGYDSIATTNNRTGNQNNPLIEQNNDEFKGVDKENGGNAEFSDGGISFENLDDLFRWAIWNDTGLTPEKLPEVMAEDIKEDIKEGAQAVADNAPTVLGAAALYVPNPLPKLMLSASSVVTGVAQDVENGNVNNTVGSAAGEFTQKVLEKVPGGKGVSEVVGFGVSEVISRNIGSDDDE